MVTWALSMTENTSIEPDAHERQLLDQFVAGVLTIDEVVDQLARREAGQ